MKGEPCALWNDVGPACPLLRESLGEKRGGGGLVDYREGEGGGQRGQGKEEIKDTGMLARGSRSRHCGRI